MPTATEAAPDAICAAAVDVARAAAIEDVGPELVGEHVGVEVDAERIVTHLFECLEPAYYGWRWGVQVVRAARAKSVTVNEVFRLPGPDALVAPPWVPWAERLRPGDLGPGELLPTPPDDDRLVLAIEDDADQVMVLEQGIGRARVLSLVGRTEAAERWYEGDAGPETPHARHAPAHCLTCGFFVPLSGPLGLGFGVCANEFSPDDGRVVAIDHGCGAHSEGSREVAEMGPAPKLVDEFSFELVPGDIADEADEVDPVDAAGEIEAAGEVDVDGEVDAVADDTAAE